jgi:hypothetical protein
MHFWHHARDDNLVKSDAKKYQQPVMDRSWTLLQVVPPYINEPLPTSIAIPSKLPLSNSSKALLLFSSNGQQANRPLWSWPKQEAQWTCTDYHSSRDNPHSLKPILLRSSSPPSGNRSIATTPTSWRQSTLARASSRCLEANQGDKGDQPPSSKGPWGADWSQDQ